MNWVGGSRSRLVMKNNAKKQREFFEKRKMHQRLKNLGIAIPSSPPEATFRSMDLVNLFVVNQIAAKKESKDPPKVAVFDGCKGAAKHRRNKPAVLPMSPCSPSQLSLAESPPHHSLQGMTRRKPVIPQGFKCRQLSPVMESAFSNNSASHTLQLLDDPLSPFSSTSSASSDQSGIFLLQRSFQQKSQNPPDQPHRSPPPWDTFRQEWTEARNMTSNSPWSCGSNPHLQQPMIPTAVQFLFESPEPDQSEDKQCVFDFMLNQSGIEQQFEEDVCRGFNTEEYEREGTSKSKIYLKGEISVNSSTPQTVPDSECTGVEEEERCQLCIHSSASLSVGQACCADNSNSNQESQEKAKQRQPQSRPLTPLKKVKTNFGDEQEIMENMPRPEKLPATGRQTDTVVQFNTHTVSPGNWSGVKHTPWGKKSKDNSLLGRSPLNMFTNSDSKAIPPQHAFLNALIRSDNRGKENGEVRGEQENVSLMKGCSDEVRKEVTSAAKVNRLSEEAQTLQEIADVLLVLKQE
ncbi:hypothetical protein Q5P01_003477 [Channa striata]|uniref:Uncharacterized protein n=1 Tax=Channa striata TaxID=64152 RepID=A0AA88T9B2_CHASR|nr:hypothetical protein Q5P01_003477 [Channa striata]